MTRPQNQTKHLRSLVEQAEKRMARQDAEIRKWKAEAQRNPLGRTDINLPELALFIHEYGELVDAADPTRGRNFDSNGSKAADQPDEGQATEFVRSRLNAVNRQLVALTRSMQAALGTPPDERAVVTDDGKCVTCGRNTRRPATRVVRYDKETA